MPTEVVCAKCGAPWKHKANPAICPECKETSFGIAKEKQEVITRTLRDNQSQVLADKLEELLPKITEEGKHKLAKGLLEELRVLKPNPDQKWADLYLTSEEDTLLTILEDIVWKKSTPKPNESHG